MSKPTLIDDVARIIFEESAHKRDERDDRSWDCVVHDHWLALARNIIALVHAHDITQTVVENLKEIHHK